MKKFIIILSIFILISYSASAVEYDVKWFNLTEKPTTDTTDTLNICYAAYDNIIINDSGSLERIYDINGNPVIDKLYNYVYPFNIEATAFKAYVDETYSLYSDALEDEVQLWQKIGYRYYNDNILYKDIADFYVKKGFDINYGEPISVSIEDLYDSNGRLLYKDSAKGLLGDELKKAQSFEKFIIDLNNRGTYNVMNEKGEYVVEDDFENYNNNSPYGYFYLRNDNKVFLGNSYTGNHIIVDSVADTTWNYYAKGKYAFAEKTHEGKYIYYNENFEKVTDIEFDEYLGEFEGSMAFKQGDTYYVFDTEFKLGYSGEKKISAVFYDEYVIEKDNGLYGLYDKSFNEIISPVYSKIIPICDNVYLAQNESGCHLYNQGNLVASEISDFRSNQFIRDKFIVLDYYSTSWVYDVEGNLIARGENVDFYANDTDIFIMSYDKKDCGRLIVKDSNPNIRINRIPLISDTVCRIKNNITLIPLRAMAEETGFNTEYIEETKEIRLTKEDKEIVFKIGDKKAISNGAEITLNAAPEIINNRTLVPARAVSDAFGYDIEWDGERRLVEITTN